jgi:hypothetical protein
MNVEIETEAAQFPEREYINDIFVAVWAQSWMIAIFFKRPLFLKQKKKSVSASTVKTKLGARNILVVPEAKTQKQ